LEYRERARRLLLHAYATSRYKLCYKLYVDEYPYPIQFLIPCEQPRRRTVGDEAAFNILYQLGIVDLIRDSKAGAYVVKVKDERIAKIEAEKFIERIEENLKKLIRKYGWEVAFITYGRGEKWRGEDIDIPLLKVLRQNQLSYEQPSIYFEHKELLNRIEIAVGALRPVIKEKYQEFWNELEKLGLAFSCEDGLILLPEAQRIMIKFIEDKVVEFAKNDKLIRDLALLNVLYYYFPLEPLDERTLKGLFEILNTLGLKLEDLEKASQELYDQGLTSRFIKDQPPYMIIYNTNKFREAIIAKIKLLYNQLST
jgi:hypothetical protein